MRYKRLLTPLGLNAHWSFRSDIWGIGTTVAGIGNMISQLATNHENVKMQEEINRRNIENQWAMFRAQNNRQDFLNREQDLIKRQSLAKAGMNVNSEFGGYPNIATNQISQAEQKAAQMSPPDFSLFAQMLQQQPLIKAQVDNINADTKKKEAETENTAMDTVLKNTQNWSLQQLTPEQKKNMHEQSELFKAESEKARVSVPFIQKQMEKCQSEIAKFDVETSWLLDSYDTRLGHAAMQVAVLQSQNSLNIANAAVAYKSLQVMATQMRLMESEISLNSQKWMELNQLVQNLAIDGNFKDFEYNIKKKYGDTEAQKILELLNEKTLLLRSEQQWRPLTVLLGLGNMGVNMAGAVK